MTAASGQNPTDFPRKWIALLGLSLLSFTAFLDFTIVVTALPFIQKDLNAPIIKLQWVTNIFAMVLCMFMIVSGKLGDIYGRRRVFYLGFLIFATAALGAGSAPTINWLIFFRAIQGFATSIIATNGMGLLPQAFPENEQTRALSIFSAMTGAGLAIGPFAGGMLITFLSWRWVFWINIPIIIVGLLCCLSSLKASPIHHQDNKIDWWGLLFLILGLGGIVYGVIAGEEFGWDVLLTWVILSIGFISAIALIYIETKVRQPLLDLRIFTNKHTALAILLVVSAGFPAYVFIFFDPLYLQIIRGFNAFWIGIILVTVPIVQVVLSLAFEKLERKVNVFDLLIYGIISAFIASVLHLFFTATLPFLFVILSLMLMGYTWGMGNVGSMAAVTRSVPAQQVGTAVGTIYTFWNVSGSIMLAISTVIFHWRERIAMQQQLSASGIHLSQHEYQFVHRALINPENATQSLNHLPQVDISMALNAFQHSFVVGYQWVAGLATLVIFLVYVAARQLR